MDNFININKAQFIMRKTSKKLSSLELQVGAVVATASSAGFTFYGTLHHLSEGRIGAAILNGIASVACGIASYINARNVIEEYKDK